MQKVIVFDLGGTLMEYRGMPLNWSEYYYKAFAKLNEVLGLKASEEELVESAAILKSFNPRISGRDYEIAPEIIFSTATANWKNTPNIETVIGLFFRELDLHAIIFDYSIELLMKCKNCGYKIACLTDLPNGMPDEIFKTASKDIVDLLDLYVSSQSCGRRKPSKEGLLLIADAFHTDVSELLFVGDEEKDKRTAQNAGCNYMFIGDFLKCFEYI